MLPQGCVDPLIPAMSTSTHPASWVWTDHTQISLPHLPTPPKCSTRAIGTLINNLGIVCHQYCSSSDHAHFIHQALCSPPTPTLLRALAQSSELTTIPGLTPHLIVHHLPPSTATDKGHMRRHRQGVQSTRTQQPAILQACSESINSIPPKKYAWHMTCFASQPWPTCTPGQCISTAQVPSPCDHSATCNTWSWPIFTTSMPSLSGPYHPGQMARLLPLSKTSSRHSTPMDMHPHSMSWTMSAPRQLKPTSGATTWTSTSSPPTITK